MLKYSSIKLLSKFTRTSYPLFKPFLSLALTDSFLASLVVGRKNVCVIAPPKTGSTWLSVLLEEMTGWPTRLLAPAYCQREQEISLRALVTKNAWQSVVFSHVHLRYSQYTETVIRTTDLKCILLIRNLPDTIVSLYDHCNKLSRQWPIFSMTDEWWNQMDENKKLEAIVSLAAPWYFNFYAGWLSNVGRLSDYVEIVRYESLLEKPAGTLQNIATKFKLPAAKTPERAIEKGSKQSTLKNAAVAGRGDRLPAWAIEKLRNYSSFYPRGMFDVIGL